MPVHYAGAMEQPAHDMQGESGQCTVTTHLHRRSQRSSHGCTKVHLVCQHVTPMSSQVDGWTPPRAAHPTMHVRADGAGVLACAVYLCADLTRFVRRRQICFT